MSVNVSAGTGASRKTSQSRHASGNRPSISRNTCQQGASGRAQAGQLSRIDSAQPRTFQQLTSFTATAGPWARPMSSASLCQRRSSRRSAQAARAVTPMGRPIRRTIPARTATRPSAHSGTGPPHDPLARRRSQVPSARSAVAGNSRRTNSRTTIARISFTSTSRGSPANLSLRRGRDRVNPASIQPLGWVNPPTRHQPHGSLGERPAPGALKLREPEGRCQVLRPYAWMMPLRMAYLTSSVRE